MLYSILYVTKKRKNWRFSWVYPRWGVNLKGFNFIFLFKREIRDCTRKYQLPGQSFDFRKEFGRNRLNGTVPTSISAGKTSLRLEETTKWVRQKSQTDRYTKTWILLSSISILKYRRLKYHFSSFHIRKDQNLCNAAAAVACFGSMRSVLWHSDGCG